MSDESEARLHMDIAELRVENEKIRSHNKELQARVVEMEKSLRKLDGNDLVKMFYRGLKKQLSDITVELNSIKLNLNQDNASVENILLVIEKGGKFIALIRDVQKEIPGEVADIEDFSAEKMAQNNGNRSSKRTDKG